MEKERLKEVEQWRLEEMEKERLSARRRDLKNR